MQLALDLQDDTSAMASMVSLINIESLFSLLIISLIFRFDFSLTIEQTLELIWCPLGQEFNLKKRKSLHNKEILWVSSPKYFSIWLIFERLPVITWLPWRHISSVKPRLSSILSWALSSETREKIYRIEPVIQHKERSITAKSCLILKIFLSMLLSWYKAVIIWKS